MPRSSTLARGPAILALAGLAGVLGYAAEAAPASGSVPTAKGGAGTGVRIVEDRVFTRPAWAFDIRWSGDGSVLLAAGREGVFEVSWTGDGAEPRQLPGSEQAGYATRLAVTAETIATAAPFGVLTWRNGQGGWRQEVPLGPGGSIVDFDLRDDRLLFLGGRRVEVPGEKKPVWAPEGGITFTAPLDSPADLTLRGTAASGAGGKALEMAHCEILEPGAVRFLAGGRYVVVPGFQPGIAVYSADGALARAWDGGALDLQAACPSDPATARRIGKDLESRVARWQRHPILDDVVPWGDGFALIVRRPTVGGATWELIPFGADGAGAPLVLPLEAAGPGVRLRADSRGHRLALLLSDREESPDGSPLHPHRLVVVEMDPSPASTPPTEP